MELIIKKCAKCGAYVEVLNDCSCEDCGLKCCGEEMKRVVPNSVDCSIEKHVPNVEICGNYIYVTVNHVMEDEHYIEWIAMASDKTIGKKFFKPGEEVKAIFPYVKGSKVYAYCNKHGLWENEVK